MLSLRQIIIKNMSWLAIGEVISMAILFTITVVVARTLGDTIYGQFAFILAFAQLWQVLADFGLSIIGIREFSNNRDKISHYLGNFLSLKIVISLITFFLIIITVQLLQKPPLIEYLVYIAGGYIIFYTFTEFLRSVFRGFEKFKYEAAIKITQHLILLSLIIIGALDQSLVQITYAYLISAILATGITLIVIKKKFTSFSLRWDSHLIKYLLKEAWPMALANVFVIVYFRIDTVMLSLMKGDQPTGWYNVAYLLIFSLSFVPYIIMNSLYPRLSRLAKKSLAETKKLYRQSLMLVTAAGLIILGICDMIIRYLIPWIYGSEYNPAINIFYILSLAVFFAYLSNVWLYTLNALGRQKIYMLAAGAGMITNLVLNFILIPRLAHIGAAWATVATEVFMAAVIFIGCEFIIKKGSLKTYQAPRALPDNTL